MNQGEALAGPILIVDDSETLRITMRKMLQRMGYQTLEAENATTALHLLRSDTCITLALIDYNMPDMNGIELIKAIKNVKRQTPLPCVIFTSIGQEMEELMEAAKDAGAMAWLTKPVQPSQLQEIFQRLAKG